MDCLVTKLKASVNNDNLRKLGVFSFSMTPANAAYFEFSAESALNVSGLPSLTVGGTLINPQPYKYNGDGTSKRVTLQQGVKNTIEITNNHTISSLFFNKNAADGFDSDLFGELKYLTGLTRLEIINSNKDAIYNFEDLSDLTLMTRINVQNSSGIGDIAKSFGKMTALTKLQIGGTYCHVNGSLESFVQAQRAAPVPRTAESTGINVSYIYQTKVTFDGELITQTYGGNGAVLTWDASSITLTLGGNSKTVTA